MTIRPTLAAALALTLAACDGGAEQANTIGTAPSPTPTAAPSPKPLAALPATLQGRWGTSPQDCAGTGALRMTVAATTMTFSTSKAKVRDIVELRPDAWTATLDYTNRQGKWSAGTRLELQQGGTSLQKHDDHPSSLVTYNRCPA